jgi:hypothetical protein
MGTPSREELHRNVLRIKVLPAMDYAAERDISICPGFDTDDIDVEILREYIFLGRVKTSGIYTYDDERVGTFFYSVFTDFSGDKTLMAVGVGSRRNADSEPVYSRLMDAVIELAKEEGCRWIKAGSTRLGAIRMMLEKGATPVRVEFCLEVKG